MEPTTAMTAFRFTDLAGGVKQIEEEMRPGLFMIIGYAEVVWHGDGYKAEARCPECSDVFQGDDMEQAVRWLSNHRSWSC